MRKLPRPIPTTAALALAAACSSQPAGEPGRIAAAPESLGLFGAGYPQDGDLCRRAGETAFTNRFLDDAADLVACPPGTEAAAFAHATGGAEVARVDGWILFSIPRR
jgi:hypothetical protein